MSYVPREAEVVEGDLCDMESLEQFFRVPADSEIIVLHIASIVTVNPEYAYLRQGESIPAWYL